MQINHRRAMEGTNIVEDKTPQLTRGDRADKIEEIEV